MVGLDVVYLEQFVSENEVGGIGDGNFDARRDAAREIGAGVGVFGFGKSVVNGADARFGGEPVEGDTEFAAAIDHDAVRNGNIQFVTKEQRHR